MTKPKFPCAADLAFYESKRTPRWALPLVKPSALGSSIDSCVNAHGGFRYTSGELAAHNLLAIVRGKIRRDEDIRKFLVMMSHFPECAINPQKRAAFARKWANRLGANLPEKIAY